MPDVTDLRQLVLRQLAVLGDGTRPMSHREAAARSGGRVSHATIGNIAGGRHSGNIDDSTIDGLALALDLKRSEILAAMHRSHEASLKPFDAPERWQRLTHAQRKLVIALGDGLLAAYEEGRDHESSATGQVLTGSFARGTAVRAGRPDVDVIPAPEGQQRAARRGTNRGKQLRDELDRQAETPPPAPADEP